MDSGVKDYIGAFAVTTGTHVEARAATFEGDHDDHQAIMVKPLVDRFAEACAEYVLRWSELICGDTPTKSSRTTS